MRDWFALGILVLVILALGAANTHRTAPLDFGPLEDVPAGAYFFHDGETWVRLRGSDEGEPIAVRLTGPEPGELRTLTRECKVRRVDVRLVVTRPREAWE